MLGAFFEWLGGLIFANVDGVGTPSQMGEVDSENSFPITAMQSFNLTSIKSGRLVLAKAGHGYTVKRWSDPFGNGENWGVAVELAAGAPMSWWESAVDQGLIYVYV